MGDQLIFLKLMLPWVQQKNKAIQWVIILSPCNTPVVAFCLLEFSLKRNNDLIEWKNDHNRGKRMAINDYSTNVTQSEYNENSAKT
jgi:hypothetical protein